MSSEMHSVIITIMGVSPGGNAFADELHTLFDRLQALLPDVMPSFVLAHPPISITTHELLTAPEHRRMSPLVASAEHEIITAAQLWRDSVPGAADRLREAIAAWERFPEA